MPFDLTYTEALDKHQKYQWGTGPLLAQSAHAATAVLHLHAAHPDVQRYLEGWRDMRKAVLEVGDPIPLSSSVLTLGLRVGLGR